MNAGAAPRTVSLVAVATIAATLVPAPAGAHLVTTGLGPLYDGITHVAMSPDDLVAALALAFLAGLNGAATGRRTLFTLTSAWFAGGIAGLLVQQPVVPATIPIGSFLVLGVLTAADRRLSPAIVSSLAIAVGLLHGWLNGAGIAGAGRDALGLAGIVSAIFVLVALAAAFAASVRLPWARIAVRVVGSWVAAIGLLMLGWVLRGGA